MTGYQIAQEFSRYFVTNALTEWNIPHVHANSAPWACHVGRLESEYGIYESDRVAPDVAANVLRHFRFSLWQFRARHQTWR